MSEHEPEPISMMGKKSLKEVRAEVVDLLATLPGPSARQWLDGEIEAAKGQPERDLETLKMIRAALERQVRKTPKRTPRGQAGKH